MTSLSPRQFDFWGGSTPYGPQPDPATRGMRDPGTIARLDKASANANIGESYRKRMSDQDYAEMDEEDRDEYETPASPHPRTGLPDRGELGMSEDIGIPVVNNWESGVPGPMQFHAHEASQRRKVGRLAEVPLGSITTQQATVSSQRVHEILDNPETQRNPRFPAKLQVDVPLVHRTQFGDHILVDGNHRVAAAALRNEMFTPARVTTDNDADTMARNTKLNKQRQADHEVDSMDRWNRYLGTDY